MLAPDVRFEGFAHADWARLLGLLRPDPDSGGDEPGRVQGGLIAVHSDSRLLKLLHTRRGRLPIAEPVSQAQAGLDELMREHGARWALRLRVGALESAMAACGARLQPEHGLTELYLLMLDGLLAELGRGRIELAWGDGSTPTGRVLARWLTGPLASSAALRQVVRLFSRALEPLWPPARTFLLASFRDGQLYTSLALERGPAGIRRVCGPDLFRSGLATTASELSDQHRQLCRVAERHVAPLAVAISAEHHALQRLLSRGRRGSVAAAREAGELCIEPLPASLEWVLTAEALLAWLASPR